ncbi:protein translocase subunit SecD [Streptacidiphilus sp. NEAU-YB345]|uniref:Protein translocase subunit SecD n=2 Tax=Streptacidiphilus fuscans TaxID=2789292 RepID=A0A931B4R7_9ACTN|nr:protein translocase subunit SecD [Streptacidiphilus fuscans]MBF9068652.1 protein translocase subunit SecD [Streptacidiphilus fuscans]
MFGTGNTKPRLGIDLAGGTSVTLQAYAPGDPQAVNPANMNVAAQIMQERVNGTGVTEATVQVQGTDEILVNAPKGTSSTQLADELSTTAKLFFRPVLAEQEQAGPSAAPSGSPSAKPSGSATNKPVASPSASKTQGDALASGLKSSASASASAHPSGTASAKASDPASSSAKPSATPSASASTVSGQTAGTVPAALQSVFNATNCATNQGRLDAATAANASKDTAQIVACAQTQDPNTGGWIKYALGSVAVPGTDISGASAGLSSQTGQWQVNLNFNGAGSSAFGKITGQLASQQQPMNQFAIELDGQIQSAPSVQQAITGGQAQITGSFSQSDAQSLANVLSYGSLPLNFTQLNVVTVSPELGGSQLTAGLVAGAIGLALVVLYSLLYYRGLGLVAVASLAVSGVLTWSIMALLGGAIGFALNLPAVCGAIVAIGITADSFVVYFERIRDELREGASLRPAVRNAWPRARRTILVSDAVSFLAAAVLYFFTVGKVQGFAFTLGLTTLLDVVVIFLFTKPLISLLARKKFFASGHPWSGLSPERLGVRSPLRDGRPRRPARPTASKEA